MYAQFKATCEQVAIETGTFFCLQIRCCRMCIIEFIIPVSFHNDIRFENLCEQ